MNDPRWRRIEELFHEVSGLPPEKRSDFLDRICAGDPALRREVVSLLESMEAAGAFMASPVVSQGLKLVAGSYQETFGSRSCGRRWIYGSAR
jgi:hypothetical protein